MEQESTPGVAGQVVTRIELPDGRLAVEVRGSSESTVTVVFLHGLTANRSTWWRVCDLLGVDRRLLLLDFLSRGDSDGSPEARFGLEAEAGRLTRALQALGVRGPVLAGHSHGAAVAVAAASRTDARGLLLVNPVTPGLRRPGALALLGSRWMRRAVVPGLSLFRVPLTRYMLVRRVFTGERRVPPGAVKRYARPWGDPDRARALPRILADWDPAELAGRTVPAGVPVRVLAGGRDRRIASTEAEDWAATLGATFELYPSAGHALPEEEPRAVAERLRGLVETVNGTRGRVDQA